MVITLSAAAITKTERGRKAQIHTRRYGRRRSGRWPFVSEVTGPKRGPQHGRNSAMDAWPKSILLRGIIAHYTRR
jgi:hypothetical protein